MKESGQLDRIIRAWISKPSVDCWESSEFKSMGIEETVSAFAVILAAFCLATGIFFLNVFVHWPFQCRPWSSLFRNIISVF